MNPMPLWVECIVAVLLVAGGLFALIASWGLVRLKDFFQRMHAPSLAVTLGTWSISLASVVYFSVLQQHVLLHAWLIPVFLSITVPITTSLLARVGVFRQRLERATQAAGAVRDDGLPAAAKATQASPASTASINSKSL